MSTKQTFRQAKTYVASRTFMQTDPVSGVSLRDAVTQRGKKWPCCINAPDKRGVPLPVKIGQPTDSNLAQPSSVILLRAAHTDLCLSFLIFEPPRSQFRPDHTFANDQFVLPRDCADCSRFKLAMPVRPYVCSAWTLARNHWAAYVAEAGDVKMASRTSASPCCADDQLF